MSDKNYKILFTDKQINKEIYVNKYCKVFMFDCLMNSVEKENNYTKSFANCQANYFRCINLDMNSRERLAGIK
jgi:hypothetical protein